MQVRLQKRNDFFVGEIRLELANAVVGSKRIRSARHQQRFPLVDDHWPDSLQDQLLQFLIAAELLNADELVTLGEVRRLLKRRVQLCHTYGIANVVRFAERFESAQLLIDPIGRDSLKELDS